ncbi:MAG: hypothetical protein Q4A93_05395 [Actinomycetota bacterium]|nr:hypothetical protein [Actinomycetota bacterium]
MKTVPLPRQRRPVNLIALALAATVASLLLIGATVIILLDLSPMSAQEPKEHLPLGESVRLDGGLSVMVEDIHITTISFVNEDHGTLFLNEQTAPAECLQATITVLNLGDGSISLEGDVFGPEHILALQTADGSVVGKVLQFDDGLHGSLDSGAQTTGTATLAYSPSGSYGARFDDETGAYYYDYTTSGITDLCLLTPPEHLFSWHLPSNRP